MVEHNDKHRYQSAEEVLRDLELKGFRKTWVVAPGGGRIPPTIPLPPVPNGVLGVIFQLPMWLRFAMATPLVAILAFVVPLMLRSIFVQPSPKPETPKREEIKSPKPTPEPSDDDIFKRPPGTP